MEFLDLGVEQVGQDAPDACGLTGLLNPLAEVRGEGVEVQFQAITTEHREVGSRQRLTHLMDEVMGHLLSARAECEGWDKFGRRIQGNP